jgi:hypothetical protein
MRIAISLIVSWIILNPSTSYAQGLELGLDWNMAAIVSANEYTNGATEGAPSLSFSFNFENLAAEIFYKKYKLANTLENSLGRNELEFEQNIFGLGLRLTYSRYFLTRFGLQYVDLETKSFNSNGRDLNFNFDEESVGLYGGGGLQFPITETFHFQTVGQMEVSQRDLTVLSFFFGFRYQFMEL